MPTPPVGGENSNLDSVSCTSASACTAVGTSCTRSVMVARKRCRWPSSWNGSRLDTQGNPEDRRPEAPPPSSSVSCTSASSCTAVGFAHRIRRRALGRHQMDDPAQHPGRRSVRGVVYLEHGVHAMAWSGEGPRHCAGTAPAGRSSTRCLVGAFAWHCVHIGHVVHCGRAAGQRRPWRTADLGRTAERGQMGPRPTPDNPTAPRYNLLTGVSCGSAAACVAVGGLALGDPDSVLTEVRAGGSWAISRPAIHRMPWPGR